MLLVREVATTVHERVFFSTSKFNSNSTGCLAYYATFNSNGVQKVSTYSLVQEACWWFVYVSVCLCMISQMWRSETRLNTKNNCSDNSSPTVRAINQWFADGMVFSLPSTSLVDGAIPSLHHCSVVLFRSSSVSRLDSIVCLFSSVFFSALVFFLGTTWLSQKIHFQYITTVGFEWHSRALKF